MGVNYLRRRLWPALAGLVLVVFLGILLIGRSRVESQAATGIVQLILTASLTTGPGSAPISTGYQRVALNILGIRLNPSNDLTISDSDPSWVTIPAPAEVGLANTTQFITTSLNFGTTGTLVTAATSELQLDLMPLQNFPFFYNSASITAGTYGQIELILDFAVPGNVVPLCPPSVSGGQGCLTYNVLSAVGPRAQFPNGYGLAAGAIQPLVVNIAVNVAPIAPGAASNPGTSAVPINATLTPEPNGFLGSNEYNTALGVVTGEVAGSINNSTTVTAELSGTDQIVATTHLLANGSFILNLPALPTPGFTSYDFYLSGNGGYVVRSGIHVSSQGTAATPPPPVNLSFALPSASFGSISGSIIDGCNGQPVQGASLKLLVADTTTPGSATTCNLTGTPPAIPSNCVVVATAATDDVGSYPIGGTLFTVVPVPPPGVQYNLEINAPGYNTTVVPVGPGSLLCPLSRFPNSCSFSLEHGYLTGITGLSAPDGSGQPLNAMVMAEDTGTNTIENFTLTRIPGGGTAGTFTMNVPDAAPASTAIPVAAYDLFSSMQDLFLGAPQKTTGHLIGTAADVAAPGTACGSVAVPPLSPMDCAGLGSVSGTVSSALPGTTSVRLSKNDVQIMETEPDSIGAAPGNGYSFCAPFDSYTLTHYENSTAASSPAPITLAPPIPMSCANPSICENAAGICFLCQPTAGPALP
ncbi:MAG TPA: hypothetical protein VJ728_15010 [Candidatus Binataceae bacterium]|nr:hypothetical protein [Candidatus Binataceae bacterium]